MSAAKGAGVNGMTDFLISDEQIQAIAARYSKSERTRAKIAKAIREAFAKETSNRRQREYDAKLAAEFGRMPAPGMKLVRVAHGYPQGRGKVIEIALDTPACCDPSTETYWSM
jgi:hypothetical protein